MAAVTLRKPLGLVLEDRDAGGVCIEELKDGGIAKQCGKLKVGDILLKICDTDVSAMDLDATMEVIEAAPECAVTLLVGRLVNIRLPKPFGFELEDGEENGGVVVGKLLEGGFAARSRLVRVGDIIVTINGQDVHSMDVDRVLAMVAGVSLDEVPFTVFRVPDKPPPPSALTSPPVVSTYEVSLSKPLGMELEDEDGGGVAIDKLVPEGYAQLCGEVMCGDILLEVGRHDVSAMDVDEVIDLISRTGDENGKVRLKLGRLSGSMRGQVAHRTDDD
eukprot:TRINITY_DN25709_c0_g1_i2.p1 TRINITY_DN25709_c0_g1~~TRINITY_DN25709_c0_g1_i2.p1  ORF type:complete len:275 (-),score=69.23 TRINITY_DN25709_c0_g1_i2:29-853(-)